MFDCVNSRRVILLLGLLYFAEGCSEPEDERFGVPKFVTPTEPEIRGYPDLSTTTENVVTDTVEKMDSPFIMAAVERPVRVTAEEAKLMDQDMVIGVVAGDEACAYSCEAMSQIDSHVINDVVGGKGLTVTFCDRTDHARILCSESEGTPPKVQVGGLTDDAMVLYIGGKMYEQTSPEVPLSDHKFLRTTWKHWKTLHPNTLVYTGGTKSR